MTNPVLAIGIDPAKRVHRAVAVLFPDTVVLDVEFPNDITACGEMDARMSALAEHHGAELVYGIEDHRLCGRTVTQVLADLKREIRIVNPLWTNRQRDFYGQDKDDSIDGRCVAAVVLRRRDHLGDAAMESELAATIREAERALQNLAHHRTRATNQLHLHLNHVYASCYDTFFFRLASLSALKFFARFPLPQDLEDQDPDELAEILLDMAGGRVGPYKGEARLDHLRAKAKGILETTAAGRAWPRTPALELKAELIRQLCEELRVNLERASRLERMLKDELLPASGETISTIPGIGTKLAAAILGEIGDIRRFRNRNTFAKYNGTAPASNSTGGQARHTARNRCNRRLKRAFWLAARAATLNDPLAANYFDQCRCRGLSYNEAVKRVARRMSDLVFAMLRSGKRYDPEHVEASIRRRKTAAPPEARQAMPRREGSLTVFRQTEITAPVPESQEKWMDCGKPAPGGLT